MRYPIHYLNDKEFEKLVVAICRELLGFGVTSFASGPDGGRDALFEGTANIFPSESSPAQGKFVIQAKHTQSPVASCSDSDFKNTLLIKELSKVKRLYEKGELTHYILFTNRKKTAGADEHFRQLVNKETEVTHAWLRGWEDIEADLRAYPQIVQNAGLDRFRLPLDFSSNDYRDIIEGLYANRDAVVSSFDSEHNFKSYPGFDGKNVINGVSEEYGEHIKEDSMNRFNEIERFLKNPRNEKLKEKYHVVANELKGQLIVHTKEFESFEYALEAIPRLIQERSTELQAFDKRRLLKTMIHYMYVNCDIGKES